MNSTRPADYSRLIDAAQRHAAQLRRQAIADFWDSAAQSTLRSLRSARRLASSLARHARLRGRACGPTCPDAG